MRGTTNGPMCCCLSIGTVSRSPHPRSLKLAQRQRRQAADEIWDYCWMLNDSLCSIFWDDEVPDGDKGPKMETSVDEFVVAVKAAIPKWVEGTPAG